MKRVLISLLLGLLFMVFASRDSSAKPFGPPCDIERGVHREEMSMMPPPMGPPFMERMKGMPEHPLWIQLMKLGLDLQQREAVKEIKNREMKEIIRNMADEQIAGIELQELLDKDTVDIKAVEMKLRHIDTVKTAAHLSFIRAIEEVKSKLTPEQRNIFREMIETGPDTGPPPPMMKGMMHGGMKMPPPPCE
jgi:Spy/CpxP family protein refolding chaperone